MGREARASNKRYAEILDKTRVAYQKELDRRGGLVEVARRLQGEAEAKGRRLARQRFWAFILGLVLGAGFVFSMVKALGQ